MIKKKLLIIAIAFIIFIPLTPVHIVHAGIVPNCNTGPLVNGLQLHNADGTLMVDKDKNPVYEKVYANPCNFENVMKLINNSITFLLFDLAAPLVAIILIYAGFILITSGGSSESRTKAKKIIKNVIFGYVIALCAWLIIHTIFNVAGITGTDRTFLQE